jgi:hypothetical protein
MRGEISLRGIGSPTPRNQCWPGGVPFVSSSGATQLLQQPDKITILYNYDHQVRHVRLNRSHPTQVTPSWYGDSVGHYEGDTLIIDTVGIKIGPFAMWSAGASELPNQRRTCWTSSTREPTRSRGL